MTVSLFCTKNMPGKTVRTEPRIQKPDTRNERGKEMP